MAGPGLSGRPAVLATLEAAGLHREESEAMAQTIMFEGLVLSGVHDWRQCQSAGATGGDLVPRDCVIHRPSRHHMRDLPLHWRDDRGIFERICDHGVGHPDPDQFQYWREQGTMSAESIHGCDGCCRQPFLGKKGKHVLD